MAPRIDPTDRSLNFHDRVFAAVRTVPPGRVTTYGDVGTILGSPHLARQVGWALSSLLNEREVNGKVPWHRVINARGSISHRGDIDRAERQRLLLEEEGVLFDSEGFCELQKLRWGYPDFRVHSTQTS